VTPLTYAVVNASKRIAIITISILLLKNPITWTNIVGMTLAVSGVFLYNRVKSSENLIPKTVQEINFNYINI
jgi:solute carrier family 35 protein E1